jgi:hypothetical protein
MVTGKKHNLLQDLPSKQPGIDEPVSVLAVSQRDSSQSSFEKTLRKSMSTQQVILP